MKEYIEDNTQGRQNNPIMYKYFKRINDNSIQNTPSRSETVNSAKVTEF